MSLQGFTNHKQETQKIIEAHKKDFNCNTVKSFLLAKGGYKAYVKSLGGVFAKYVDFTGKITTTKQLEEIADYVWGLYDIWGVDYSNGCSYTYSENIYKAYAKDGSQFYPKEDPKKRFNMNYAAFSFGNGEDVPGIDEMLSNPDKYYAVVNCGQGPLQVLKKAGLCPKSFPDPAEYPAYWKSKGYNYSLIKDAKNLKVGDIIYLFNKPIANRNGLTQLNNWHDGGFHTTMVGERNNLAGTITYYDSGHAYTCYGEYRSIRKIGEKPYEWATDWIGLRFNFGLKEEQMDINKSAIRLAIEVLEGKYGSGETRKNNLGSRYAEVQTLIDKELKTMSVADAIIDLLAQEVLTGYWGSGDNRKNNLTKAGYDYSKVQARVNKLVGQNNKPKEGWIKENNKWYYYKDNKKLIGLQYLEYNNQKNWYYFDANGIMVTGEVTIKAKFDNSGKLVG